MHCLTGIISFLPSF
uniref:Uncharacterized protein n=1 Tax=Arundo donax TaxID=35708 RepID=A0A0A9BC61_ARUDO